MSDYPAWKIEYDARVKECAEARTQAAENERRWYAWLESHGAEPLDHGNRRSVYRSGDVETLGHITPSDLEDMRDEFEFAVDPDREQREIELAALLREAARAGRLKGRKRRRGIWWVSKLRAAGIPRMPYGMKPSYVGGE